MLFHQEVSSEPALDLNDPYDFALVLMASPVLILDPKVCLDLVHDLKWAFDLILDLRELGTDSKSILAASLLLNFQTGIAG